MDDYTSPADEYFFGALGRTTIGWAHLECGLDLAVLAIHNHGGSAIDPEMPRALQRKLTYLRKMAATLASLAAYQATIAALADEIEAASETRHDLIHGWVVNHAKTDAVTATMVRLLREAGGYRVKVFNATTKSVLEHAVHVQRLGGRALELGISLAERFART